MSIMDYEIQQDKVVDAQFTDVKEGLKLKLMTLNVNTINIIKDEGGKNKSKMFTTLVFMEVAETATFKEVASEIEIVKGGLFHEDTFYPVRGAITSIKEDRGVK